jgi:hypothetical protein
MGLLFILKPNHGSKPTNEQAYHQRRQDNQSDVIIPFHDMGELEKIADETTEGMSKLAMLRTAHELEEIARIIRSRVCSSCEQCELLPCSRGALWKN